MSSSDTQQEQYISRNEVKKHNKKSDCWIILNNKVFNVTSFLSEHPGGSDIILKRAGEDATQDFLDAYHSDVAKTLVGQFFVGQLALEDRTRETDKELDKLIFSKEEKKGDSKKCIIS